MMSLSMEDEVKMMLGIMRLEKPNQTLSKHVTVGEASVRLYIWEETFF